MATYPIKMLRDEDRQPFVPFTNAAAVVDSNSVTLQELMDNGKYKIQNNVTTSQAGKGVLDAYQGKVLNDKFSNYVPLSQKGVANGVATLDGDAKVPTAQLPSYVDDVIEAYIRSGATALSSTWLSLTDGGAALTPEKGKIYIIMSSGSYQNKQYRWSGSTYVLCNPSDVNSVNGFTGVVTLKNLTIQKNGTQVGDTFNGSVDKTINIVVPTKTSDITNDSGFITSSASITGNAATADKLKTARNINTVAFDGTADITIPYVRSLDTRNQMYPSDLKASYITTGFSSKGGIDSGSQGSTGYVDYIAFNSWANDSGGQANLLFMTKSGDQALYHYRGAFGANTWASKKQVAYTDSNITGNASTATTLATPRKINGTNFDGSADITTTNWGTSRNIGIVNSDGTGTPVTVAVNGSQAVNLKLPAAIKANVTGSLTGNADTATKATGDKNGLDITNYIKGLSVNGKVITYTKGDNTTGTITTQDTVYTLPIAGTGVNGTLGGIKVGSGLIIDSGTGVLSATGGGTADSVEWSGVLNKPTDISYWNNDSGYITLANVMAGATASTAGAAGVVPKPNSGDQAKYLRGDGQWATPTGNTYTAGTGIDITNYVVKNMGVTDVAASPSAAGNGTIAVTKGTASGTSTSYVSVKGLNDAAYKPVVTTIDTSASLPTSNAVKTFVEGKGYVTTNTTYTLSADTTNNKITLTPSSGTTQSITVPYATNAGTATATSGTLTIQKNGTNVATFNGSTATANILVPVVYTGTSTPSASTGVNGDIYIQTT